MKNIKYINKLNIRYVFIYKYTYLYLYFIKIVSVFF